MSPARAPSEPACTIRALACPVGQACPSPSGSPCSWALVQPLPQAPGNYGLLCIGAGWPGSHPPHPAPGGMTQPRPLVVTGSARRGVPARGAPGLGGCWLGRALALRPGKPGEPSSSPARHKPQQARRLGFWAVGSLRTDSQTQHSREGGSLARAHPPP